MYSENTLNKNKKQKILHIKYKKSKQIQQIREKTTEG